MILILEFYGVKFLESKYETFHHLKKNVRNVSKFKKNQHSKNTYWNTLLRETTFSGSSELLRKTKFEVSSRWSDFAKNLYKLSDFEWNVWKRVTIWRKSAWEKCRYESCYSQKTTFFVFSLFFKKHDFKSFQSIRVLTKALTTCQVLN